MPLLPPCQRLHHRLLARRIWQSVFDTTRASGCDPVHAGPPWRRCSVTRPLPCGQWRPSRRRPPRHCPAPSPARPWPTACRCSGKRSPPPFACLCLVCLPICPVHYPSTRPCTDHRPSGFFPNTSTPAGGRGRAGAAPQGARPGRPAASPGCRGSRAAGRAAVGLRGGSHGPVGAALVLVLHRRRRPFFGKEHTHA
jgi:hypothetical protein